MKAFKRFSFVLLLASGFIVSLPAQADDLEKPSGKVLLTIDGNIGNTTDGERALFDRAQLESLDMQKLETTTPYTKGKQSFEGILFSRLLDKIGARGTVLQAMALDGYSVDIPIKDLRDYPVLLAMKWNGKVMRVRTKGPLWVIYPIDQYPELGTEKYSTRSIWQLKSLTVK